MGNIINSILSPEASDELSCSDSFVVEMNTPRHLRFERIYAELDVAWRVWDNRHANADLLVQLISKDHQKHPQNLAGLITQ